MPGTNVPDPNFGKCLQCAAIDRARFINTSTSTPRSAFCETCFAQYCFDLNNLTSAATQLPGRRLVFVDPDPQGVSALTGFLSDSKLSIVLGFVAAGLVVAAICAFLCVLFALLAPELILTLFFLEYGGNVGRRARLRTNR